MAEVIKCRPLGLSSRAVPKIARLLLSVPPLVKTISLGLRAEDFRRPLARVVQQRPRLPPDVMHAGRIAPDLAEKRQHRLAHRRIQRRRGVVIEVNRPRHGSMKVRRERKKCRRLTFRRQS